MNLQEEIKSLKAHIALIEKQLADEKEQEESKFERAKKHSFYYHLIMNFDKEIKSDCENELYTSSDTTAYENNNYFHTRERAEEVAKKIKMLLMLERLHDTFCPDYKPDVNNTDYYKYSVDYDAFDKMWKCVSYKCSINPVDVYFPTEEIAQKVCNILNKEDIKP